MFQRAWFLAAVLLFALIIPLQPAPAQEGLTLTMEPPTLRAGENVRIELRGRPESTVILAASTANSGLGQFAGQTVLLGPDAFVLFTVQTDAEGGFERRIAMPPGIGGAFFFQAALAVTPDFSQVVLSNGAQLTIEGLPADPATVFIPEDDADGDGIPNFAEGGGDADNDGVPNFLDPDADGDGVADSEQTSSEAISFLDTDSDGIADFLDQDDDGDGIPDDEDDAPLTALTPTDFTSDVRLAILSIETEVTGQSPVPVTRAGRGIDLLVQRTGQGGGAFRVLFPSDAPDGRKLLASPSAVLDDSASGDGVQRLTVTAPAGARSGRVHVVQGNLLSEGVALEILPLAIPLLFDLKSADPTQPVVASVAELSTITIVGEGFAASDRVVFQSGVASRTDRAPDGVNEAGTELTVGLPSFSGQSVRLLWIERDGAASNRLLLNVTRQISGRVELPDGLSLDLGSLKVEAGLISETTPAADGTFTLPLLTRGRGSIEVFDASGENMLLIALVDRNATEVTVTTLTTVTAQIARALLIEMNLSEASVGQALAIIAGTAEVGAAAEVLGQRLAVNPQVLVNFDDAYAAAFNAALLAVDNALRAALTSDSINAKQRRRAKESVTIEPEAEQEDISLKESGSKPGNLTVENDTQLFLSVKMTDKESGTVLQPHITTFTDSNLVGPQSGISIFDREFFTAAAKDFKQPRNRDVKVEVLTGANLDEEDLTTTEQQRIDAMLEVRFMLDRLFSPALGLFLDSILAENSLSKSTRSVLGTLNSCGQAFLLEVLNEALKTDKLVPLLSFAARRLGQDAFRFGNLTKCIISSILGAKLKKIADQASEILVEAAIARIKKKVSKRLAAFLVGLGQVQAAVDAASAAVEVAGTVISIGKAVDDISNTSARIDFEVDFDHPVVNSIEPDCISSRQTQLKAVVKGRNFRPTDDNPSEEPNFAFIFNSQDGEREVGVRSGNNGRITFLDSDGTKALVTLRADAGKSFASGLVKARFGQVDPNRPLQSTAQLDVAEEPHISNVDPARARRATVISMAGCGFAPTASDNVLTFTDLNGTAKTTTPLRVNEDGNFLTVQVPFDLAPGPGNVTVTSTITGSSLTSKPAAFFIDAVQFQIKVPPNILAGEAFAMQVTAVDPLGKRLTDFNERVRFLITGDPSPRGALAVKEAPAGSWINGSMTAPRQSYSGNEEMFLLTIVALRAGFSGDRGQAQTVINGVRLFFRRLGFIRTDELVGPAFAWDCIPEPGVPEFANFEGHTSSRYDLDLDGSIRLTTRDPRFRLEEISPNTGCSDDSTICGRVVQVLACDVCTPPEFLEIGEGGQSPIPADIDSAFFTGFFEISGGFGVDVSSRFVSPNEEGEWVRKVRKALVEFPGMAESFVPQFSVTSLRKSFGFGPDSCNNAITSADLTEGVQVALFPILPDPKSTSARRDVSRRFLGGVGSFRWERRSFTVPISGGQGVFAFQPDAASMKRSRGLIPRALENLSVIDDSSGRASASARMRLCSKRSPCTIERERQGLGLLEEPVVYGFRRGR